MDHREDSSADIIHCASVRKVGVDSVTRVVVVIFGNVAVVRKNICASLECEWIFDAVWTDVKGRLISSHVVCALGHIDFAAVRPEPLDTAIPG